MKKTKTTAQVTVVLLIPVGGTWGPECTQDQVMKQAAEGAVGIVRNMFKDSHITVLHTNVKAVITEEEG